MKVPRNYRISEECDALIKAESERLSEDRGRKVSEAEVIELAITKAATAVGVPVVSDTRIDDLLELMHKADARTSEILEHAQSQVSIEDIQEVFDGFIQTAREARAQSVASDPRSVPGVQAGYEGVAKNAYCKHCGNKFAGSKYAQVCLECEDTGHKRVPPAECPGCQAGNAL